MYNERMNVLRRILVGIAFTLLPLTLFIFGLSFGMTRVFGDSGSIKHALSESGIYDSAATQFLSQIKEKGQGAQAENIPVDRPEVQDAVQKALPPASIQQHTEKALDDIYAWLQGKTDQLNISIDLGQNKTTLLDNLVAHVKTRAASLPICPPGAPIPQEFDAFNATCRPAAVSPDMAAQAAKDKLAANSFFKDSTLNTSTIKDEQGQTLGDRLHSIPEYYKMIMQAVTIAGIVALVCVVGGIFLSDPWRVGLRRVAKVFLSIGIATVILAWLSVFLSGKAATMLAESAGQAASFQASIADIVHMLASDIRAWWLGYGILLIILAIAAFLVLKVLKEKDAIDRNNAKPPEERPTVVVN